MKPHSHRKIFIISGLVAVMMYAFAFALVPIYSRLCRATGINTSVRSDELFKEAPANSLESSADQNREVVVQFIATNHNGLPWDFYPRVNSIRVHPGQNNRVTFFAKNDTDHAMTVQAIPSMTPPEAISHFHKIECFCFKQQTLRAREAKDMPLVFQVDKKLPQVIHTITLAYTLFDVTQTKKGKG